MNRPVLRDDPILCPGGYSLHLYCKYENDDHEWGSFPAEFGGFETGGETRSQARRFGWILHRDGTATCPKCAKALALGTEAPSGAETLGSAGGDGPAASAATPHSLPSQPPTPEASRTTERRG